MILVIYVVPVLLTVELVGEVRLCILSLIYCWTLGQPLVYPTATVIDVLVGNVDAPSDQVRVCLGVGIIRTPISKPDLVLIVLAIGAVETTRLDTPKLLLPLVH